MDFPVFRYHPNPLSTEAIIPSSEKCDCCGEARGFAYCTTPYGLREISCICPWCIYDGSANRTLGAEFVDVTPLIAAGIPRSVVEEVSLRTPGFISWQQEQWLVCCGDACEFHGDAPAEELCGLDTDGMKRLAEYSGFMEQDLPDILKNYVPKGSPAFYKFVCRNCGRVHYSGDGD